MRTYRHIDPLLRGLLIAASASTGLIALWLFFVCAVVLPRRDPDRIALWLVVAGLCAAFAVASAATVSLAWRRPAWLAGLGLLSAAAIAFGGFAAGRTLQAMASGRPFEGYLLLIGVLLAGHGVVAATFAVLSARVPVQRVTLTP